MSDAGMPWRNCATARPRWTPSSAASPVILNICDEDFRYIKTSGPLPDYFGLDSRSIVGKSLKELDLEYFKEYGRMLERVIETGEPVHNVEMKSRAPSRGGEMVYWRASHFPLTLPNGRRARHGRRRDHRSEAGRGVPPGRTSEAPGTFSSRATTSAN